MKIKWIFAATLLFCVFTSCNKETSLENGVLPQSSNLVDSNYIDTETTIRDTTGTGGTVDSSVAVYSYDNLKRVVKIKSETFSNNVLSDFYESLFYYTAQDTLPNKYIHVFTETAINLLDTITGYPVYDGFGRVIIDSSIEKYGHSGIWTTFKSIQNRVYKNGYMVFDTKLTHLSVPPAVFIDGHYLDTAWTDANQNVVRNIKYNIEFPPIRIYDKGVYSYDNKPSPYSHLNIFSLLYDIHSIKEAIYPQVNNILTYYNEDVDYNSNNPPIYSISFINSYNNRNMLVKSVGIDNYGDPVRHYFTYKAL
jgi:hypothetical protein